MLKLAKDLSLPVELSGRRTAVFGISGSGKSNTATRIVEDLLKAGEQVVMIDPKGEGWGLLSLANGKPSNLPLVIFGEPNGHISEINESHGAKLADFVFETGQSVALSVVGFESDQSERRFVATFMRQLYRRKSKATRKSRTLVVFDEAHLFVPESSGRGFKGDQAELSGAVQRIARQGRTFGLGSLFIDQRPQDVAKRVISQVDTIICHQLIHKTDRDALRDWVKGYDVDGRGETFLDSLASLQPGEAWIWSPAWLGIFQRIKAGLRTTFDSGAAPDGSEAAGKVQRAEIDLDSLRGQLSEIVEKAKANDPKVLQARIRELEKAAQHKPVGASTKPVVDQAAIDRAVAAAEANRDRHWKGEVAKLERSLKDRNALLQRIEREATAIAQRAHLNGDAEVTVSSPPAARNNPARSAQPAAATRPARSVSAPAVRQSVNHSIADSTLGSGEAAVLTVIAQHADGVTRDQLTVLAGYKRSTRDAYIQRLRGKGLVNDGATITATDAGIAALGDSFQPLPTGDELREHWLQRLPDGERRVLEVVIAAYPEEIDREAVSDATEFKRSTRDAYLQRLRSRKLVSDEGRGQVRASDLLFG